MSLKGNHPSFHKGSWPPGDSWDLKYDPATDRWVITTNLGVFVASVGPTLVAHWFVEVFNERTRESAVRV